MAVHSGKSYSCPHRMHEQLLGFVGLHLKISHNCFLSDKSKGTTCPIMPFKTDECVQRAPIYNYLGCAYYASPQDSLVHPSQALANCGENDCVHCLGLGHLSIQST